MEMPSISTQMSTRCSPSRASSSVCPSEPFMSGSALSATSTASTRPCQYERKTTALKHRNFDSAFLPSRNSFSPK